MSEAENARWYVVHTYSGYENKVKADIEKTRENRNLQDQILEVVVPVEDATEIKNGVKKEVSRKILPGYVLLNMVMNDVTWYVVRNTRGVTGFVGSDPRKPVPLTEEEINNLYKENQTIVLDVEVGDTITVTAGAWEGTVAAIKAINTIKQTVSIEVEMFGRVNTVDIAFADIKTM
jgi:transcriptional antiterminator NusG